MSGFKTPADSVAALAAELKALREAVRTLEARQPFQIPVLSTDPATTDPTNMWVFPDGRLRYRHLNTVGNAYVTREVVPTAAGSSTSGTSPAPAGVAPISRQATWDAIWSQSYQSGGTARTDDGVYRLYYGDSGDGVNGNNRSLVGFDYAAIATALSSSTVTRVRLRMVNLGSWYSTGVTVYFGIHNSVSEPSSWSGGGIPASRIASARFGNPEDKVIDLPLSFATAVRDGWGKGLALEAPSSSKEFYGYAAGVGSGYTAPQLIVDYAK